MTTSPTHTLTDAEAEAMARAHHAATFDHPGEYGGWDHLAWHSRQARLTAIRAAYAASPASSQSALGANEARTLRDYRAAAHFIGGDSWDGCSDCMDMLRAAVGQDMETMDWTPDDVANALRDLRERTALAALASPAPTLSSRLASLEADNRRLREALGSVVDAHTWNSSVSQCLWHAQQVAREALALSPEREGGSYSVNLPSPPSGDSGQWRDIGSAPRDGTKIDLWCVGGERGDYRAANAEWVTEAQDWRTGTFTLRQYVYVPTPTHWMPLPNPPASDALLEKGGE